MPFSLLAQVNSNHQYVSGYTRSDGTQVKGYYRTQANSTVNDNFSTVGNTNPYTGQAGWVPRDNGYSGGSSYSSTNNYSNYTPSYSSTNYNYSSSYTTTPRNETKTVNYTDGKEIFEVCIGCNVTAEDDKEYVWANSAGDIEITKGFYAGTLLNGKYVQKNESGIVTTKASFKKGIRDGDMFMYNDDGSLDKYYHFSDGVLDFAKYKDESGYTIKLIGPIGEPGFIKEVYDLNNDLLYETEIDKDGVATTSLYYEGSSQIMLKFTGFDIEDKNGPCTFYYENGVVGSFGDFEDNKKTGDWYYFDEEGQLTGTETF